MGKIYGEDVAVRPAFPDAMGKKGEASGTPDSGLLLYIHVPFCRSRCHYCSFHSQAFDQITFQWYVKTLLEEIKLWGTRLKRPKLATVYFGGGTPSLMPLAQFDTIMTALRKAFQFQSGMEITLEANPDSAQDISWYRALLSMGFNRLSLGIQSLDDQMLYLLGRPHSAKQAVESYQTARRAGFNNISVDFIWGLPGQKYKQWMEQLKAVVRLKPEHISSYGLTVEPKTVLGENVENGNITLPPEQEQGRMFIYGSEYLESQGYIQYEVSNFARMGFFSVHNSGYWEGRDYLGLGPSAVSTIGRRRFANPRYMDEYDAAVRGNFTGEDYEMLDDEMLLREQVMLSLRTTRGLNLAEFRQKAGYDLVKRQEKLITALYRENLIRISGGFLKLTKSGMLASNIIIRRLIFEE